MALAIAKSLNRIQSLTLKKFCHVVLFASLYFTEIFFLVSYRSAPASEKGYIYPFRLYPRDPQLVHKGLCSLF